MYYSSVGLLAALVLIIINQDVLLQRKDRQSNRTMRLYRNFLYSVLAYYITDILWGILDDNHLIRLLFIDTTAYYLAMAFGVFFWTQYVIAYLDGKGFFAKLLSYTGFAFLAAVALADTVNVFTPVLFWLDESGAYHACSARHILLIVQILLFLLTSAYAFSVIARSKNRAGKRYRAIALCALAMALLLTIQLGYPLLPLYSAGYLLGTCLLHTFVFVDEKEVYQKELERSVEREKRQREDLISAQKLAHTDAMTGVKNKLAFSELQARKEQRIAEGKETEFAIAVFDLNDLKAINDRLGHEVGDQHIINACRMICDSFKHSPVFRIGGDEFAVFLENTDYWVRERIMRQFDTRMEENAATGGLVIAAGISDFVKGKDTSCIEVFERADQQMYLRKRELKAQPAT